MNIYIQVFLFGFSICRTSANRNSFVSCFALWMPSFSSSYLFLARTYSVCWIEVTRLAIILLVLTLGRKYSLLPLCMFLLVGFFCRHPLWSWGSFFYSWFVACSYHERVLDFVICFFWVIEMIYDFCLILY